MINQFLLPVALLLLTSVSLFLSLAELFLAPVYFVFLHLMPSSVVEFQFVVPFFPALGFSLNSLASIIQKKRSMNS